MRIAARSLIGAFLPTTALVLSVLVAAPAHADVPDISEKPARIYFATASGKIMYIEDKASPTAVTVTTTAPGTFGITGLAIDASADEIYYIGQSSNGKGYIRKTNLGEGSSSTPIQTIDNNSGISPLGLAYDSDNNKMYWSGTFNGQAKTYVGSYDGSSLTTDASINRALVLTYDEEGSVIGGEETSGSIGLYNPSTLALTQTIYSGTSYLNSLLRGDNMDTYFWTGHCATAQQVANGATCPAGVLKRFYVSDQSTVGLFTGSGNPNGSVIVDGCVLTGGLAGEVWHVPHNGSCTFGYLGGASEKITAMYAVTQPKVDDSAEIHGAAVVGGDITCEPAWSSDNPSAHVSSAVSSTQYVWYLDGVEMIGENDQTLTIPWPGQYSCTAYGTNAVGSAKNESNTITVDIDSVQIGGHLRDATGAPVVGALVEVKNVGTEESIYVSSDSDGYFSPWALPSGTYKFFVEPRNEEQGTDYAASLRFTDPITLSPGTISLANDIIVKRNVHIRGRANYDGNIDDYPLLRVLDTQDQPINVCAPYEDDGSIDCTAPEGEQYNYEIGNSESPDFAIVYNGVSYWSDHTNLLTAVFGSDVDFGTVVLKRNAQYITTASQAGLVIAHTEDADEVYSIDQGQSLHLYLPAGPYTFEYIPDDRSYFTMWSANRGSWADAKVYTSEWGGEYTLNFIAKKTLGTGILKSAVKKARNRALVSWYSLPGATTYQVKSRYGASVKKLGKPATKSFSASALSWSDISTSIKKKPMYACYSVRAVRSKKYGAWSKEKCVKLG